MTITVECVGYKTHERNFIIGELYEWEDNTLYSITAEYLYDSYMVEGIDPKKWRLSHWYEFRIVTSDVDNVDFDGMAKHFETILG